MTPNEFQQEIRMRRAATMLCQSSIPVSAIARSLGYDSQSHFARLFKSRFGTEPSSFRRKDGGTPESLFSGIFGG